MTDPRDGRRVALKKLPNVFQSLVSSKRVFRELKMLCYFKHENVSTEVPCQLSIVVCDRDGIDRGGDATDVLCGISEERGACADRVRVVPVDERIVARLFIEEDVHEMWEPKVSGSFDPTVVS